MDVNLGLFSERLRRLLADEEVILPDVAKEQIQNLQSDIDILTSLLRDYEVDMSCLLIQIVVGVDVDNPDLLQILESFNYLVHESEKAINTFLINIMHQNGESCSKELCDTFSEVQYIITAIKQRIQQLRVNGTNIDDIDSIETQVFHGFCSSSESDSEDRDMVGLEDKMEELLNLLIEGQPSLSIIAIVDSSGFKVSALAVEAYNSNFVKNYFDCHAWVPVNYNTDKMLDDIMKSLMPLSKFSEIMDKDYQLKKITLRDYLKDKRYFIVLDDVYKNDIWDNLNDALPDYGNGSRVLTRLTNIDILTSFQLENGEKIRLDLVPPGGPFKVTYNGWPFIVLCYGNKSLEENIEYKVDKPLLFQISIYLNLPFYLKLCFLYFSLIPVHFEISTRQLYQLWIAEGFIPDNSETTADEYLEELISRGLIQVKKRRVGGTVKACYTNFISWATSANVAQKVEFATILGIDLSCNISKRLVFHVDNLSKLWLNFSDSYLHSLQHLNSDSHHLAPKHCDKICKMFKNLRVLNLRSLVLSHFPSQIENLIFLRYLKLDIPSLKSLPLSLCNLLNLYSLDMPSSYIDHAPDDIWKMNKLRHLNFGYITLPALPEKYSNSLENINFISALYPSCCTPNILGRLPNLQNLKIYGDISRYQSVLSKSLCKLNYLEALKLMNKSSQPPSIVMGEDYKFPQTLTHLSLSNTELKDDPMPTLEKLPHLQVLKLKHKSFSGRKLACSSDGFPQLQVLHLKSMLWLDDWTMETGAMPKLKSLIINPCAYLRRLPEELWRIKSFNKLELWWPQSELKQKLTDFEDNEQYDIQIYPLGL